MSRAPRSLLRVAFAAGALVAAALTAAPAVAVPTGALPYAGGAPAGGEHRAVAGIRNAGSSGFFCTGTLAGPSWILTAAHCVDGGVRASSLEVVIGDTDLDSTTDPAETRRVDNVVVHSRWGGDAGDRYDIAMLHLTAPSAVAPVALGPGARTALARGMSLCARMAPPYGGTTALLRHWTCVAGTGTGVGWGRTPSTGDAGSRRLMQARADIYAVGKRQFWRAKSGACPGDSGGPLLARDDRGRTIQIGVASYATHGGGWFDWLVGGRCDRKGVDYYSDVSRGELLTWVRVLLASS